MASIQKGGSGENEKRVRERGKRETVRKMRTTRCARERENEKGRKSGKRERVNEKRERERGKRENAHKRREKRRMEREARRML